MNFLIVGNGLDIACGYPTSLTDCWKWLHHKNFHNIVLSALFSRIDEHYRAFNPKDGKFWKDFENNLYYVSLPSKKDFDPYSKYYYINLRNDIYTIFKPWVKHICEYVEIHQPRTFKSNSHIKNILNFIKLLILNKIPNKFNKREITLIKHLVYESDYVLNFNYTKTLEYYFNKNNSKVIHIHGTINDPIIGHGHSYHSALDASPKEANKIRYQNDFQKPWLTCFYKHESQFQKIHNITKMIFFGISYSRTDWTYYKYMSSKRNLNCFNKNCIGIFYYYKDASKAKKLCDYLHNSLGIIKNTPTDNKYFISISNL